MADKTKGGEPATAKLEEAVKADLKSTGGLTAADAARAVTGKVRVPRIKDGKPVMKDGVYETMERQVRAEDVLSYAVRDGVVSVVTIDGQRLTGDAA